MCVKLALIIKGIVYPFGGARKNTATLLSLEDNVERTNTSTWSNPLKRLYYIGLVLSFRDKSALKGWYFFKEECFMTKKILLAMLINFAIFIVAACNIRGEIGECGNIGMALIALLALGSCSITMGCLFVRK